MYTFYACTHIHACTAAAAAGAAAAGGAGAAAAAGGAWCGMVRRVLREARGPASGGGPGVQCPGVSGGATVTFYTTADRR